MPIVTPPMDSGIEYYDRPELWGPGSGYEDSAELIRAQTILEAVPVDAATILDVGCGDGTVTNLLTERYETTGVDIAPAALVHVRTTTVLGSADALPFGDETFDVVVLAEVLEHLEPDVYGQSLAEAARVARRAIIITVPNHENILAQSVRCPRCGTRFSPIRHMRSFTENSVRTLFPDFSVDLLREFGPNAERIRSGEALFRRLFTRHAPLPFPAVCPQCKLEGERKVCGLQGPSFAWGRRIPFASLLRPVQPRWILARFRK